MRTPEVAVAVNTSATRTATRSLALGSVFLLATTALASSMHGVGAIPRGCPSTAALGPPSLAAFVESIQDGAPAPQGARLSTGEGATLFATFCATCHGR